MKIKELIEILKDENPKARVIFEYDHQELSIDELDIESGDSFVVLKLIDK